MKQGKFLLLLLVLIPFLYGAADLRLADIETAIIQEDYHRAQKLAKEYLAKNPNKQKSDEAHYYLGLSLLRLERYAQAREVFEQLIRYHPEKKIRDKVYLGIIDANYMEEQYQKAIETAQELLRVSPSSEFESLIYLKSARSHLKLAQWEKARNYLMRIVNQFPKSMEFHTARQLLEEKQYFAVQVGSFLDQKHAEDLIDGLKQKGEYAYIVETVDKAGRKFYRVRVGQLSQLNDAKQLKGKLTDLGYPTQIYP
ncbi:MAG: tetratricopeptide repeat protein [Candidatus Omnitrophota bacterium]